VVLALLVWWEYAAKNSNIVRVLISSPSLIVESFAKNYANLLEATWVTFYEALTGLAIATIFSFGAMTLCFYYPKLMEFILPIMVVSQVIPLITLAPLFIILFGSGVTAKVMMAALLCFFPIFVNFANGVKLISKNIHEMLYTYNATTTQKIKYMYFPLAMPNIMTGLKVAATLAVIGAIVAEFNGAEVGLGKNLFLAAKRLEPELMMASLALSSLLGGFMYLIILFIEKKFGKWYLQ
jgi:NitT/TauT family transport system permease protein